MRPADSGRSTFKPIVTPAPAQRGLGLLLVGLLLGLIVPMRVAAQEVRLLETYTSPSPERAGFFGFSVTWAGDANGDGTPDLLIGATGEDIGGTRGAGRAYVIDGADGEVLRTLYSPNSENVGFFGHSVASAGDANGDGTPDFLVGVYREDPRGTRGAGRAYVINGASGEVLHLLTTPNPEKWGRFGYSVAGAGDSNGDGTSDLLIGAYRENPGGKDDAGRAYLFDGAEGKLLHTFSSPNPEEGGRFGFSVARAGHANGDGPPDLLVGAQTESSGSTKDAGRAYLFDGADGEVLRTLSSPNPEEGGRFGFSVARAGDANGDSTPDLLVGASSESPAGTKDAGRAYLIDGATGEVLRTLASPNPEEGGRFGFSVAGAGDANGDGTPDLFVGAPQENPGGKGVTGRAYLFDGATGKVLRTLSSPNPEEGGRFGSSVAGAGDANGDALIDLLVGAYDESPAGTNNAGRVYRFKVGDQTE